MAEEKFCKVCGKSLSRISTDQSDGCSSLECQYQRQLENMKMWRSRNPNYFKYKGEPGLILERDMPPPFPGMGKKHQEYLKLTGKAQGPPPEYMKE